VDSVSYSTGSKLFLKFGSTRNPFGLGIISNKLHACADIGLHQLGGFCRLRFILLEEAGGCGGREPSHFHASNEEPTLLNMVDNFTCVHVSIRLNHGEGRFFCLCETAACEYITILYQFKLSRVDHDDGAQVKIVD
jgi:hypothetical protein